MVETGFCTRCGDRDRCGLGADLQELARPSGTPIEEIYEQLSSYKDLKERAQEEVDARKEKLAVIEDVLQKDDQDVSFDMAKELLSKERVDQTPLPVSAEWIRQQMEEEVEFLRGHADGIELDDLVSALKEYEEEGFVEIRDGIVTVTSRGARLLASQALKRIAEKLAKRDTGYYPIMEFGVGTQLSLNSRAYDLGDRYELVDIEKTLVNAMGRSGKMSLEVEDFCVFDTQHQSGLCSGLLIDESGSMQEAGKVDAAIEVALALSELIRRNPKDALEVFIFADKVNRISSWDIVNKRIDGGSTNMKAVMTDFRKHAMRHRGDKQAYLITDTEPNFEDGEYVGFEKAMQGVIQEALKYRESGITLNIVMLSQRAMLRDFARTVVQKNLGRVFFADSQDLGTLIIEDYLRTKRKDR